jgi:hypothetical protein
MHLPADEGEIYLWIAVITAIYLLVAYSIQWCAKGWSGQDQYAMTRVFDGATFSGSVILLLGFIYPSVLKAMGNTQAFLLVAAFGGIVYGLHALRPR